MRFPDDSPVTPAKREELKARLARLQVALDTVDEQALKAGGPGGQKVNKTSSGVLLRYRLGADLLVIKWTRERSRALNRFLALRELAEQVEQKISPQTSPRLQEFARIRARKARARRRSRPGQSS